MTSSHCTVINKFFGVLLSVIVPGFGLVPAGKYIRGFCWFICIEATIFVTGIACILPCISFYISIIAALLLITLYFLMLVDSYRSGKMTTTQWIIILIILSILFALPSPISFIASAHAIVSADMEPALQGPGDSTAMDHVVIDRLSYKFNRFESGDLVAFRPSKVPALLVQGQVNEDEIYVMRLVGLPGDMLKIKNNVTYINGRNLDWTYDNMEGKNGPQPENLQIKSVQTGSVIGPEEFFVLSDNPSLGYDSRYWGCVPKEAIYGRVSMIYYPFSRIKKFTKENGASLQKVDKMNHAPHK